MPEFIYLLENGKRVGLALVILDNIAVFTTDKNLTRKWKNRIELNRVHFNLKLNEDETQSAAFSHGDASFKPRWLKNSLTFGGIEFSNQGWRSASADRSLPGTLDSPQAAAVAIGLLLWDIRVRGEKLLSHPRLLELSRLLNDEDRWPEAEKLIASAEFQREYAAAALRRAERSFSIWQPRCEAAAVLFAVTDATPDSVAWIVWDQRGNVELEAEHREEVDVHFQELAAILLVAKHVLRKAVPNTELRVLTDSKVAYSVVRGGGSRSRKLHCLQACKTAWLDAKRWRAEIV
jgi:hypothetical protein